MANKVKVWIDYYKNGFDIFNMDEGGSYQEKTFKDEMSAVQWCRMHHANIGMINSTPTAGRQISHFEIMEAIRER